MDKEPQPTPSNYSPEIQAMLASHMQELLSAQVQSVYSQRINQANKNTEKSGDMLDRSYNEKRLKALSAETYFAIQKLEPWPQFPDRPFGVVLIKVNPEDGTKVPASDVPITHIDEQANEVKDLEPPYAEMGDAFQSPFTQEQIDILLGQLKQQEAAGWTPPGSD